MANSPINYVLCRDWGEQDPARAKRGEYEIKLCHKCTCALASLKANAARIRKDNMQPTCQRCAEKIANAQDQKGRPLVYAGSLSKGKTEVERAAEN